jgi:hypothetical protein
VGKRVYIISVLLFLGWTRTTVAQGTEAHVSTVSASDAVAPDPAALNQIINRIIAREHYESVVLTYFHPVLQTHIWDFRPKDEEDHPWRTWDYSGRATATADRLSVKTIHRPYTDPYSQGGFWQMAFVDRYQFDRQHYIFTYVGREDGDFVFDVRPVTPERTGGHFLGRIWAEPSNYAIVHFRGTFTPEHYWSALAIPHPMTQLFPTFDSYRSNVEGDLWLPSTVKSEEDGLREAQWRWNMRSQTTFSEYPVAPLSTMSLPQFDQQRYQNVELPPVRLGWKFWTPWILDAGFIVGSTELEQNCMHTLLCAEINPFLGGHASRAKLYSLNFGLDGFLFYLARRDRLRRDKFWADVETYPSLFLHGFEFLDQLSRVTPR